MKQPDSMPPSIDSAGLAESIRIAWERGETKLLEQHFGIERLRGLSASQLLDLVYEEFLARRRVGQSPAVEEYLARFPEQGDAIRRLFNLHDEIGESLARPVSLPENLNELNPTVDLAPGELTRELIPEQRRVPESPLNLGGPKLGNFGDYELLAEIARGGMGVVYRARQKKLNRIVALKMILAGQHATAQDVQRFYNEAEAAAHLEHPHIVPIYEVGEYQGHHFFSMGYIEGSSLVARLAGGPMPAREAATMLRTIAEAMQYAHGQGVIHRDLKPGNILLDKRGAPRVTDFGLAKRIEADASELTRTGQVLGTPSYMPPEQALGRPDLIGPLADIYALGAVLYAMLSGRPPFLADSPIETLRQVLEREPVPPRQLNAAVPPDLETICLKCLEKTPAARYGSAEEVAAELGRFLEGKPILARPIGRVRRAIRWCQRNRAIASLLAAVVLTLLAGIVTSSTFALISSQRAVELTQKSSQLEQRLGQLENTNAALSTIFEDLDPHYLQNEQEPLQAVFGKRLDQVAAALDRESIGDKLVVARMQKRLALSFEGLGHYDKAIPLLRKSSETFAKELGLDDDATLTCRFHLGRMYSLADQTQDARETLEKVLEARRNAPQVNPQAFVAVLCSLSTVIAHEGKHQESLDLCLEALRLAENQLGSDHPQTYSAKNNLAVVYDELGKPHLSIPLHEQVLQRRLITLGPQAMSTQLSMRNLGLAYIAQGQFKQAELLLQESLQGTANRLGKEHPDTLASMHNLANALLKLGRLTEAKQLYQAAWEGRKAKLGKDHPQTLSSHTQLARAYEIMGDENKSAALLEEAHLLSVAKLGELHPDTLNRAADRAFNYRLQGRTDEGLALLRSILDQIKMIQGADHPDYIATLNNLAIAHLNAGKLDTALGLYREALQRAEKTLGPEHVLTLTIMQGTGAALIAKGRFAEALPLIQQAFDCRTTLLGAKHPDTLRSLNVLAAAHLSLEQHAKALALFELALAGLKETLGVDHPDTLSALGNLGMCHMNLQHYDVAIPLLEQTLSAKRAKFGENHPTTLTGMNRLATGYVYAGELEKSLKLFEETLPLQVTSLGAAHPESVQTRWHVAELQTKLNRRQEAEKSWDGLVDLAREALGREHPHTAILESDYLGSLEKFENWPQAARFRAELLVAQRKELAENPKQLAQEMVLLGIAQLRAGEPVAAEVVLRECLKLSEQTLPEEWSTFNRKLLFGESLMQQKKYEDAQPVLLAGWEGLVQRKDKLSAPARKTLSQSVKRLIDHYAKSGLLEESEAWKKRHSDFPLPE